MIKQQHQIFTSNPAINLAQVQRESIGTFPTFKPGNTDWWLEIRLTTKDDEKIPLFIGFFSPSQVVVWDFWTIHSFFANFHNETGAFCGIPTVGSWRWPIATPKNGGKTIASPEIPVLRCSSPDPSNCTRLKSSFQQKIRYTTKATRVKTHSSTLMLHWCHTLKVVKHRSGVSQNAWGVKTGITTRKNCCLSCLSDQNSSVQTSNVWKMPPKRPIVVWVAYHFLMTSGRLILGSLLHNSNLWLEGSFRV